MGEFPTLYHAAVHARQEHYKDRAAARTRLWNSVFELPPDTRNRFNWGNGEYFRMSVAANLLPPLASDAQAHMARLSPVSVALPPAQNSARDIAFVLSGSLLGGYAFGPLGFMGGAYTGMLFGRLSANTKHGLALEQFGRTIDTIADVLYSPSLTEEQLTFAAYFAGDR